MDSSLLPSPFVLLLITLTFISVLKIIALLHHTYFYWKNKGLPYLPNSLSSFLVSWKWILGYISLTDYCQCLYDYIPNAKYIGIVDLLSPAVFVRDPELIKDIMVKDFEHFPDHRNFVDENVDPFFGKNVSSLRGDRWREMRNTLTPTFTASKMKFMFDLLSKCSHDFVDYLVDHPELCHVIETKEVFRRYTADVIATAVFGISVNSMKDRDNEFYIRGAEATKFPTGLLTIAKFMILRACPWLAKLIGLTFFPSRTAEFFKKIVRETIRVREEQGIIRPDMIHLLMQSRDKRSDTVHKMSLDDIVSQAFIFFFAGFETSSTLMCFIAHELAVNQDIQDRLRQEVQQHLAEGSGEISYESLTKMSYMDMVVSETLRKYPPNIILDRLCAKRYELPPSQPGFKSVIVEPNDILLFPAYSLHRDPKYFPNPDKFDPERFNEENKNNILPCTYIPFGHGPRKCIGNRFVLMETKILIAHLLQKFTFKTTDKTVEPVVFTKKEFILKPVGGFWINLEKRETAIKFSTGLLMLAKFMILLKCPWLAKLIGLTIFPSTMSEFFKKIVQETISARENQGIVRPDMIHLLMQSRYKEGDSVHKMSLDDIVSQAFIFFLAGFENTAILMCFVAHELAVNRDIQDRLRQEVQQHLTDGNGEISYESLSKMTYMDMVVSEALRKYPPQIFIDRVCAKRYELPPSLPGCKNVIIEPNDAVMFPAYAIHHDPKYFPNPNKFDPERFSEENKDNIFPYTYLPFGHGPRKCIGNRFALMETKVVIAHLLQKFTLKTTEKTVEPVVFTKRDFILKPVGGFWIGLEKREI
ncbi:PREDICTED: cytochrome P450 9e2-like [Wasmannia auropunctata]|uniref:cytochrome P450 9e2-like n=1 Tax=Wasmannia auropunctata TaxID=64793 RepID=UPI0005EEF5AE|nr:PREDICTED: cytochrome P450 9e2-like [Wasmannia auropunctata]